MAYKEEQEARVRHEKAIDEAQEKYSCATFERWKEYDAAWRPLREAYDAFQKPFFDILQKEMAEANTKLAEEIGAIKAKEKKAD